MIIFGHMLCMCQFALDASQTQHKILLNHWITSFFLIFLWSTFDWHWLCGQYCWSIKMGVQTLFMIISSKCKSEAIPLGEAGQVLTLTPFSVFVRVQFLMTPITGCSLRYLPRSTGHVFNIYLLASMTKGDTVIPSFNVCVSNIDPTWPANMNSISV